MSRKFLTPIVLPADPAVAMEAVTKQYVDARAGSEVEIQTTDPIGSNASAELWYDTDEVAVPLAASQVSFTPPGAPLSGADVQSAINQLPRGLVAAVNGPAGVNLVVSASLQWITPAMPPLALTVGRRYKISWSFRAVGRTDNLDTPYATNLNLYNDVGNVQTGFVDHWHQFRGQWSSISGFVIVPGDGVLRSYRIGTVSTGITTAITIYPTWFIIEDVGV